MVSAVGRVLFKPFARDPSPFKKVSFLCDLVVKIEFLFAVIGSTVPADHAAGWIEMNGQNPTLSKRAIEGNKLLGFAEVVNPGFSVLRLKYLVGLVVLSDDLIPSFALVRGREVVAGCLSGSAGAVAGWLGRAAT
jgi:hypothetical protein